MMIRDVCSITASAVGFVCVQYVLAYRGLKDQQVDSLLSTIHAIVMVLFSIWQPVIDDDTWLFASRAFTAGFFVKNIFSMTIDSKRKFSVHYVTQHTAMLLLINGLGNLSSKAIAQIYFAEISTPFVKFARELFHSGYKRAFPKTYAFNGVLTVYLLFWCRVYLFTKLALTTMYTSDDLVAVCALTILSVYNWYSFGVSAISIMKFLITCDRLWSN